MTDIQVLAEALCELLLRAHNEGDCFFHDCPASVSAHETLEQC